MKLIDRMLKHYVHTDYVTRLKARFLLIIALVILALLPVFISYTAYINLTSPNTGYQLNMPVLLTELAAGVLLVAITYLLYRGIFTLAANLLITVALLTVWTVMAVDRTGIVSRLDSVAIILGLLSLTPLVVSRRKAVVLVYAVGNVIALVAFMAVFRDQMPIPDGSVKDYIGDTGLAMIFIGIVGYNLFTINKTAVDRATADIAARRRAEEEVSYKNALLTAQAEASADGILFAAPEGRVISYNRRFAQIWRLPDEVLAAWSGDQTLSFAQTEVCDPDGFGQGVRALYEARDIVSRDEIALRDGRILERYTEPVWGAEGKYIGRVWFFRDITAHKQDEERLRTSEERYRGVVEDQTEMIGRFSSDGVITFVNPAAERYARAYLGYEGEFIGHSIREFIKLPRNDVVRHYLPRLTPEQPIDDLEYPFVDREGQMRWTAWTARALFDEQGRAGEYQAVGRDITEKKNAEAALKESIALYREVVSSITSVVWKTGVDARMRLTDTYISESVDGLLGLPAGTVNNDLKRFLSYVHPDDLPRVNQIVSDAIQEPGKRNSCEYRVLHPDGSVRWFVSTGASRVDEHGQVQVAGITDDITERKLAEQERQRLEEQLRQAQKIESIGRLAGGIAHDFNNLLTAISGNIQLALMDLGRNRPPQNRLREAGKGCDSAAALTRQLLAFSRKQIIEPKILDLRELIQQMSQMLIRVIGEDIKLQTHAHNSEGTIKADAGQIEQIIVNLAVNARDAMPHGGMLTIETDEVVLDEFYCQQHANVTPGRYVLLAVSDTGEGMDAEVQQHLFEPFFTTKPKGKGTGLGLATIYGAVMQHRGSIQVYSAPGQGTTFKIYFPLVTGAVEDVSKAALADDLPGGSETIILVEDEPQVRAFARDILTDLGYTVMAFPNAEETLASIGDRLNAITLLLTDVVLPGMNGRVLSEEIRRLQTGIKVLFTSGYTEDVIVHHGVLEEGIQFIGKPYTASALARKIREILDAKPPIISENICEADR